LKTITLKTMLISALLIAGSELPAGMYLYSLIAGRNEVATKKIILTK